MAAAWGPEGDGEEMAGYQALALHALRVPGKVRACKPELRASGALAACLQAGSLINCAVPSVIFIL